MAGPAVVGDDGFFRKLSTLFYDDRMENALGGRLLDSYDPDRPMEVTEEKTNIVMPRGSVPDTDLVGAFWITPRNEML